MRRVLCLIVLLLMSAASSRAAVREVVLPGHTFLVDSSNRVVYGWGVRPTTPAIPDGTPIDIGTPFWDSSAYAMYYWNGSAWTSSVAAFATSASPTFTGVVTLPGNVAGSVSKSLTDAAAATSFATVAVPTNGHVSGELGWYAKSLSGADQLVANGRIRWWGTDTAGTPVCGINKIGTDGEGHSGGANTLVCTWTNVVATTNCALSVTCTNDLAAAQAITLYGRLDTQTALTVVFP